MNNFTKLLKVELMSFFDIYKIVYAKTFQEKIKASRKLLVTLLLLVYLGFYIYTLSSGMIEGLVQIGDPSIILSVFMMMGSVYIIFTNFFRINNSIFNFKDYDLLMSLPIKRESIILSKLLGLYISNFIYLATFIIPITILYGNTVNAPITFYLLSAITFVFIPVLPIVISLIIGTLLAGIFSKFKYKNMAEMILTLAFVGLIVYLSSFMDTKSGIDIANISKSIIEICNRYYPMVVVYNDAIINGSAISLLTFIFLPVILLWCFLKILNNNYEKINSRLKGTYTVRNYHFKKSGVKSPFNALVYKEMKRLFSSANYFMNACIGSVMLLAMTIVFIFAGKSSIEALLGSEGLMDQFTTVGPLILSLFCAMNCSTHSSISLEGKHFWISKSLPAKTMTILMSKAALNMIIVLPSVLIAATVFGILLKVEPLTFMFFYITPICYAIFSSLLGLIFNLLFPKFDWKNEITVIKQSVAAFLSLFGGMLSVIIPMMIKSSIDNNLYILIITIIVFIADICMYLYLKTKGVEKFNKLNA